MLLPGPRVNPGFGVVVVRDGDGEDDGGDDQMVITTTTDDDNVEVVKEDKDKGEKGKG
jgi:hypothetical protein